MRARYSFFAFTLIGLSAMSCLERAEPGGSGTDPTFVERHEIATPLADSAAALVAALDIPAAMAPVALSLVRPHDDASAVLPSFGSIRPRRGSSLLMLSTGGSGNPGITAEPGTDFGAPGAAGDAVTLQFQVVVPSGVNGLSFSYRLLSAAYPELIGSAFNDAFTVRVTDALGTRVIAAASINDTAFHPADDARVGASPFLLYVDDPAGMDTAFNTGLQLDAGVTDWRSVRAAVASGGPVTIELDLRDVGDGLVDTAVLLDAFAFSAIELVDPKNGLLDPLGRVVRDPALLAIGGEHVEGVAADGATQLLLRVQLPGPGQVVFSVPSTPATTGSLNAVDGSAWVSVVTVDSVLVQGRYYAFALYRSPRDFNPGGHEHVARREAPLTVSYLSGGPTSFTEVVPLGIVRPWVIVVPDLWSSCSIWADTGGLMQPNPPPRDPRGALSISCAGYQPSRGLNDPGNRAAIPSAIAEAMQALHVEGIAATKVDVIGHGMGGLLARKYIDELTYRRADNFNEGSVLRLITVSTPHLGSRLADEIVRFREFTKQRDPAAWASANTSLKQLGIAIDPAEGDVGIDDLMTTSPAINIIGQRGYEPGVYIHALASIRGRFLVRVPALSMLPGGVRTLYTMMENLHPKAMALPPALRRNLIFGTSSVIFCNAAQATDDDDHDLFATTWEQKGGLASWFTSSFEVSSSNPLSSHFFVSNDAAHRDRLIELLNAPLDGGLFTTSMLPPAAVPRYNSCPMVP